MKRVLVISNLTLSIIIGSLLLFNQSCDVNQSTIKVSGTAYIGCKPAVGIKLQLSEYEGTDAVATTDANGNFTFVLKLDGKNYCGIGSADSKHYIQSSLRYCNSTSGLIVYADSTPTCNELIHMYILNPYTNKDTLRLSYNDDYKIDTFFVGPFKSQIDISLKNKKTIFVGYIALDVSRSINYKGGAFSRLPINQLCTGTNTDTIIVR